MKAKIAADMDNLKSKVAQRKHDLSVKFAANYAQMLDEDAAFAIDYAIASIEQAKLAVLDAIAGHLEVEKAKRTAALIQIFDWIFLRGRRTAASLFARIMLQCDFGLARSEHSAAAAQSLLSGHIASCPLIGRATRL